MRVVPLLAGNMPPEAGPSAIRRVGSRLQFVRPAEESLCRGISAAHWGSLTPLTPDRLYASQPRDSCRITVITAGRSTSNGIALPLGRRGTRWHEVGRRSSLPGSVDRRGGLRSTGGAEVSVHAPGAGQAAAARRSAWVPFSGARR